MGTFGLQSVTDNLVLTISYLRSRTYSLSLTTCYLQSHMYNLVTYNLVTYNSLLTMLVNSMTNSHIRIAAHNKYRAMSQVTTPPYSHILLFSLVTYPARSVQTAAKQFHLYWCVLLIGISRLV